MKQRGVDRQVAVTVGVLVLLSASMLALALWAPQLSFAFLPGAGSSQFGNGDRTGTIVLDRNGTCEAMVFNNDTGRIVSARRCVSKPPEDGRNNPPAAGTAHRLDAISKSFSPN